MDDAASSRRRRWPGGGELLMVYWAAAVVLARLSMAFGKDTNWDLQNYHAYAQSGRPPWRLLARRPRGQLAVIPEPVYLPGAARSGRNPASQGGWGRALAAVQALNAPILYAITSRVLSRQDHECGLRCLCLATVLGLVSAMFLSEVGQLASPIFSVSVPTLAAVLLLLPLDGDGPRSRTRRLAFAGAMMGVAVGLKLTNSFLAAAFGCAVLVGWTSWRERLRAGLAASVGGGLGVRCQRSSLGATHPTRIRQSVVPAARRESIGRRWARATCVTSRPGFCMRSRIRGNGRPAWGLARSCRSPISARCSSSCWPSRCA